MADIHDKDRTVLAGKGGKLGQVGEFRAMRRDG
jgi:hypothetical protein